MTAKRFRKVLGLIQDSDGSLLDLTEIEEMMNALNDENEQLQQQKQQYKGQRDYLLFVIERTCSKELFEETKSYLKEVE